MENLPVDRIDALSTLLAVKLRVHIANNTASALAKVLTDYYLKETALTEQQLESARTAYDAAHLESERLIREYWSADLEYRATL
jgi:hypothetical protein